MQHQEVEAPIHRIRQPAGQEKLRLARLLHDAGIKDAGRLFVKSGTKNPSHDRETPRSDDEDSLFCYDELMSRTDNEINDGA